MKRQLGRLSALRRWARIRPLVLVAVAAVAMAVAVVGALAGKEAEDNGDQRVDFAAAASATARLIGLSPSPEPEHSIAHPTGPRVDLYRAPDGPLVERLGRRTRFGSPRTFSVVEARGDWVSVVTPELPNGRLGWLDSGSGQIRLSATSHSVHVKLSRRILEIRDGHDVVHRAAVSIGRAGHRTPAGRFAVTDALAGSGLGPWYGCCVLALSGHQPRLPSGWVGGNRIAIHGTPGPVGRAESTGCIRASNEDMVALFATVPLGAPVFIRR